MSIITTPELITDQSVVWTSVATNPSGSTRIAINDGVVYGWGDNSSGQLGAGSFTNDSPSVISELQDGASYTRVACGETFCAFLTSAGTVRIFGNLFDINGDNSLGQSITLAMPNGSGTANSIFCGPHSIFVITSLGTLFVVGRNTATTGNSLGSGVEQQITVPLQIGESGNWTKVSSDGTHTLAINGARLYAWGDNSSGQLGTGNTAPSSVPVLITALGGTAAWTDVSAKNQKSAAIFNSFLYTWGNNVDNTLAQPDTVGGILTSPTPVTLNGDFLDDCDSVSISDQHGLFVRTGNVYAWGNNSGGLTGLGLTNGITVSPEIVDSTRNWIAVSSSEGLNVALAIGQPPATELYSWGFNASYGTASETQVGIFSNPNPVPAFAFTSAPLDYTGGAKFDISSFCMIYEGDLYTWGSNAQGAGARGNSNFPTRKAEKILGFDRLWTKCTQGLGIYNDRLYSWGPNFAGLTLTGSASGFKSVPSEPISSGTGWQHITAVASNALGIRNGQLLAWGSNSTGIAGTLGASTTFTPNVLDTRTDWHQVSLGLNGMAAAIRNGRLYVWGDNAFLGITPTPSSALTVPTEIDGSTTWQWVSVGNRFTLAINDGRLYSWGMNSDGQTGLGTDAGVTATPTQVGAFVDWVKVHAGDSHAIGLRANGEIYVWGKNLGNSLGADSGPEYFNPPLLVPTRVGTDSTWSNAYTFLYTPCIIFGIKNIAGTWQSLPAHIPEAVVTVPRVYAVGYTDTAGTGNTTISGNFELLPATINRSVSYAASSLTTLYVTQNGDLFSASAGSPSLLNSGGWTAVANRTNGSDVQAGIKSGQLVNPPSLPTIEDSIGVYTRVAVCNSFGTRTLLAIKNGLLFTRGSNTAGQTGIGLASGTTSTITQVASGMGAGWTAVTISDSFAACGIFNGELYAWGSSTNGLSAQGVTAFTNFTTPTRVGTDTGWTHVSMGANHALAIKNGELFCWGNNQRGQLGLGYYGGTVNVPTRIGAFSDWTFCYAGSEVSVGIRNNTAYIWGTNNFGRTGIGAYLGSSSTPIQMPIPNEITNADLGASHGVFTVNVPESSTPNTIDQNAQSVKNTNQTAQLILATTNNRVPVVLQVNEFGEMLNAAFTSSINPINGDIRGGGLLINADKTAVNVVMSRQNIDPIIGTVSADTSSITPYTFTGTAGLAIAMTITTSPASNELYVAYGTLKRLNQTTGAITDLLELTSGPNLNYCTFSDNGQFLWQGNGIFVNVNTSTSTVTGSSVVQSGRAATFVPGSNHLLVLNGTTIHFFSYDTNGTLTNLGTATDTNIGADSVFDICAVRSSVDNIVRLVSFGQDRQRVYNINLASPSITPLSLATSTYTTGVTSRLFKRSPDSRFIYNGGNIFTYSPLATPMVGRYSGSDSALQLFGQTSLEIWDWK